MNNDSSHNAICVERDITAWYEDGSLWDRISGTNGYDEFEGIYPGCWFTAHNQLKVPGSTGTVTNKNFIIIGINSHFYNGSDSGSDSQLKIRYNHIICTSASTIGYVAYDTINNDTSGGYVNSNMYQNIIGLPTAIGVQGGTINEQLYYEFGNHLKTYNQRLSTSHASDGKIVSSWNLVQACLFNEIELAGHTVYGSANNDIGSGIRQYPFFRYNTKNIFAVQIILRDMPNIITDPDRTRICSLRSNGHFDTISITDATLSPRVKFILA